MRKCLIQAPLQHMFCVNIGNSYSKQQVKQVLLFCCSHALFMLLRWLDQVIRSNTKGPNLHTLRIV